ncbi:glycosyltransferase family 2 protein [Balneicella halophila]|nr:glycosyltransferase family A protein [Balneicella halophila]
MNRKDFSFIHEMFKNVQAEDFAVLVINQCTNIALEEVKDCDFRNTRVISVLDKGLSKSRNLALKNAMGEICVLTDDDVVYETNVIKSITKGFEKEIDVLTFQASYVNGKPFKKYSEVGFYHNFRSIMKISSIECAFRLDFLRKTGVKFDELFGLGTNFQACEENIFFLDLLNQKARMLYEPLKLVVHPYEETGGVLNEKGVYTRGAVFYRMFGLSGLIIAWLFVLKKKEVIKKEKISLFYSFRLIWKGFWDYSKIEKK